MARGNRTRGGHSAGIDEKDAEKDCTGLEDVIRDQQKVVDRLNDGLRNLEDPSWITEQKVKKQSKLEREVRKLAVMRGASETRIEMANRIKELEGSQPQTELDLEGEAEGYVEIRPMPQVQTGSPALNGVHQPLALSDGSQVVDAEFRVHDQAEAIPA